MYISIYIHTHTQTDTHTNTQHGTSFKDRVAKLKQECNTIIYVDWADCIDNSCYYAYDPKIYEHTHNMLSCWFTHTDRSALPPLVYDHAWYNVAIHVSRIFM